MKPIELAARVDAHAAFAGLPVVGFGRAGQTVQPRQGVTDLVILEPDRRQFPGQLCVIRAGVGAPIGFVQVDEDVKHGGDYNRRPETPSGRNERSGAWNFPLRTPRMLR